MRVGKRPPSLKTIVDYLERAGFPRAAAMIRDPKNPPRGGAKAFWAEFTRTIEEESR